MHPILYKYMICIDELRVASAENTFITSMLLTTMIIVSITQLNCMLSKANYVSSHTRHPGTTLRHCNVLGCCVWNLNFTHFLSPIQLFYRSSPSITNLFKTRIIINRDLNYLLTYQLYFF